nr:MAG TPA: hypothetical protein [Caudoviricetes sp.]
MSFSPLSSASSALTSLSSFNKSVYPSVNRRMCCIIAVLISIIDEYLF